MAPHIPQWESGSFPPALCGLPLSRPRPLHQPTLSLSLCDTGLLGVPKHSGCSRAWSQGLCPLHPLCREGSFPEPHTSWLSPPFPVTPSLPPPAPSSPALASLPALSTTPTVGGHTLLACLLSAPLTHVSSKGTGTVCRWVTAGPSKA